MNETLVPLSVTFSEISAFFYFRSDLGRVWSGTGWPLVPLNPAGQHFMTNLPTQRSLHKNQVVL